MSLELASRGTRENSIAPGHGSLSNLENMIPHNRDSNSDRKKNQNRICKDTVNMFVGEFLILCSALDKDDYEIGETFQRAGSFGRLASELEPCVVQPVT